MTYPPAYERTTYRGVTLDQMTKAAIVEAERRLGRPLVLIQGSYHSGVSASAGTHDGGGTVDIAPTEHKRVVRTLRELGFAAWHRPAIKGLWGEHIHAVLYGNAKLSPAAFRQVDAYRRGRDGLAGDGPDAAAWRPFPIPAFIYPPIESRGPVVDATLRRLDASHAKARAKGKTRRAAKLAAAASKLRKIKPAKRWTR